MDVSETSLGMLVTEMNNRDTVHIDECSTKELVEMISREDKKVALAVQEQENEIAMGIDLAVQRLGEGGRLFYVGAGTSGRLGIVDASECRATYGVPSGMVQAVIPGGYDAVRDAGDGDEDDFQEGFRQMGIHGIHKSDVVVGIAASGRTPFVLGAMSEAGKVGAAVIAICNNPDTPMHRLAQVTIAVITGPEVIQGSTRMKAGTAQKMVLNMLSTGIMVKLGKTYHNLMVDLFVNNGKLKDRSKRIVAQATGVSQEEASKVLLECDYQVKAAIVCILKACNKERAESYLEQSRGHISEIVK